MTYLTTLYVRHRGLLRVAWVVGVVFLAACNNGDGGGGGADDGGGLY